MWCNRNRRCGEVSDEKRVWAYWSLAQNHTQKKDSLGTAKARAITWILHSVDGSTRRSFNQTQMGSQQDCNYAYTLVHSAALINQRKYC